jgi:hypothetical protein
MRAQEVHPEFIWPGYNHVQGYQGAKMTKFWKWIVGIVVVLLIVAALAGGFLFVRSHAMAFGPRVFTARPAPFGGNPQGGQQPAPGQPDDGTNPGPSTGPGPQRMWPRGFGGPYGFYGRGPMMGRGEPGYGDMPMGRGFGFSPFFMMIGLFFGLIKLAAFAALLYGAYWLGRRSAMPGALPAAAPVTADPAPGRGRKVARS